MPDFQRGFTSMARPWDEDDEAKVASSLVTGLLSMTLKFGMYLSFPIYVAMLSVGFVHREECPVNPRIPWYLIFGGLAGILSVSLRLIMITAWSCIRNPDRNLKYDPISHPALAMVSGIKHWYQSSKSLLKLAI